MTPVLLAAVLLLAAILLTAVRLATVWLASIGRLRRCRQRSFPPWHCANMSVPPLAT